MAGAVTQEFSRRFNKLAFFAREAVPVAREPRVLHFSYHKCLTVLYENVFRGVCFALMPGMHRHFNSRLDDFYANVGRLKFASVNNHLIDFDRLPPFRATHLVRDPRDLVVSGYHYHRRGAETWCHVEGPTDGDWREVNGHVSSLIPKGKSYSAFLQDAPQEDGLLAELDFRAHHFAGMAAWPYGHPQILELRYEDVVFQEREMFDRVFDFYGLPPRFKAEALRVAEHFSFDKMKQRSDHVRNPSSGQWREMFTPALTAEFKRRHGDLLIKLGYETDLDW